jgi:hypothetical protein
MGDQNSPKIYQYLPDNLIRTGVFISSSYKLVEFSGASFHCFLHGPLSQDVKCSYIDQFGVD